MWDREFVDRSEQSEQSEYLRHVGRQFKDNVRLGSTGNILGSSMYGTVSDHPAIRFCHIHKVFSHHVEGHGAKKAETRDTRCHKSFGLSDSIATLVN